MNAPGDTLRTFFAVDPGVTPSTGQPGSVDVYTIPLTASEDIHRTLRAMLADDERARADRFLYPRHGRRFTAARAALRIVLGDRLRESPAALQFTYGAKGKPGLPNTAVQFNLSHSGDLAVLAVAEDRAVGVDLEHSRELLEHDKVAARFFSETEIAEIQSLPVDQRRDAFYACWTRKEAYMKAVGDGFSIPLSAFRVVVSPDQPAALLEVNSDPDECSRWTLHDLDVPGGYRACVAVQSPLVTLRQFDLLWR